VTAVALYPDAELVGVTFLRAALAARAEAYATGVLVGTKPRAGVLPQKYVRVRRVGGSEAFRVADSPRLQVQVWFGTGADATDESNRVALAQLVWALLRGMRSAEVTIPAWPVPVVCYRVATFGGPVTLPDPADVSRSITQLTVEVAMRGIAA
jgi:hypothetical protein